MHLQVVRLSIQLGGLIGDIIIPQYHLDNTGWVEGLNYASIKYLGITKGDGKANVMLVSSYNPSIKENFHGIIGRIFCIRGYSSAMNISKIWDVICTYAYNMGRFSHSNELLRCGMCTYQNGNYIAVQLGSYSLFDVFFSGIYSNDCVFKQVLESEVEWIE